MIPNEQIRMNTKTTWEHLDMLAWLTSVTETEARLPGFSLRLGDDSHWWISGYPPRTSWVEKLAAIMHLHPAKNRGPNRLVFFTRKVSPSKTETASAPPPGWFCQRLMYMHNWYRLDSPDIFCEMDPVFCEFGGYGILWSALHFIHRNSIKLGGLPFHATLASFQGQAVILAGPSGTGKTTCYRRLPPSWQPLCDDELLVVLSPQGHYLTHPFPTWSDYLLHRTEKSWKVENAVPLAGIFFLEQSTKDYCDPLSLTEAAVSVTGSAQQVLIRFLPTCDPREARNVRQAIFENACELVKKIPAFRLQVSLTGRFWEKIETVLGWK